jgi:hypothetical protein
MSDDKTRNEAAPKTGSGLDDSRTIMEGTFDGFTKRLRREREAQLARQSNNEEQEKRRHKLLLRAMTTIRRALGETERIDLGSRFTFLLEVSDWQGWPRVELLLCDKEASEHRSHGFIVTAGDSGPLSYIRISNVKDDTLERIQIADDESLHRVPIVLKKTIRDFLDEVALYVLDPLAPEELLEVQTRGIQVGEDWVGGSGITLDRADVFQEDRWDRSDNRAEDNLAFAEIPLAVKL